MKNMKILYFVNDYIFPDSGIGKKIYSQVDALTKLTGCCYLLSNIQNNGVSYRQVNNHSIQNLGSGIKAKINSFVSYSKVNNYINDNKIDILYVRYTHYANALFIRFLKKLRDRGVIVILEIPTYPYENEYQKLSISSRLKLFVESKYRSNLGQNIDLIVTYSNDNLIWGTECVNISNGVNPNIINIKKKSTTTTEIGFIAVANLNFWHGYDRFIRSIFEYNKLGSNLKVHLHVVGGGDQLAVYKELVSQLQLESYVSFYGELGGAELDAVFNLCQIGVDSLGRHRVGNLFNNSLKSKEYLFRGLPIVKAHNDNSIDDSHYYYQISANEDNFSIQNILIWLDNNNFSPQEIRDYAASRFSWDTQMEKIIKAVNAL